MLVNRSSILSGLAEWPRLITSADQAICDVNVDALGRDTKKRVPEVHQIRDSVSEAYAFPSRRPRYNRARDDYQQPATGSRAEDEGRR